MLDVMFSRNCSLLSCFVVFVLVIVLSQLLLIGCAAVTCVVVAVGGDGGDGGGAPLRRCYLHSFFILCQYEPVMKR